MCVRVLNYILCWYLLKIKANRSLSKVSRFLEFKTVHVCPFHLNKKYLLKKKADLFDMRNVKNKTTATKKNTQKTTTALMCWLSEDC